MWDEPVRGGLPDPSFYGLPGIEQARALMRALSRIRRSVGSWGTG